MGCSSSTTPQQDVYNGYRNGKPVQEVRPQVHTKQSQDNHNDIEKEWNSRIQDAQITSSEFKKGDEIGENHKNTTGKEVTIGAIKQYLTIYKEIKILENKNVIAGLTMKEKLKQKLQTGVVSMKEAYQQLKHQTIKEKLDVDNLVAFLKDKVQGNKQFSQEQEEYMEAKNREEMAAKELESSEKQLQTLNMEILQLKRENARLQELYKKLDDLLGEIFDGEYGSEKEDKLESELNMLSERRQQVSIARYRWHTARLLIHYACNQLAFAVGRWKNLRQETDLARMSHMAAEVRNYLVAAIQNQRNAHAQLENIQFPYCGPSEVDTLARAAHYVFTDMQSVERHAHAWHCYDATHKRCAALLYWFTEVINTSITKDLEEVMVLEAEKEKELHKERMFLMREKVREVLGDREAEQIDIDELDAWVPAAKVAETEEPKVEFAEADSVSINKELAEQTIKPDLMAEVPKEHADNTLSSAAMPSQQDIFGNIENLKKQHEEEMQQFHQGQEENRIRMQAGLHEKLSKRRRRRQQLQVQEREQQQLESESNQEEAVTSVLKNELPDSEEKKSKQDEFLENCGRMRFKRV